MSEVIYCYKKIFSNIIPLPATGDYGGRLKHRLYSPVQGSDKNNWPFFSEAVNNTEKVKTPLYPIYLPFHGTHDIRRLNKIFVVKNKQEDK